MGPRESHRISRARIGSNQLRTKTMMNIAIRRSNILFIAIKNDDSLRAVACLFPAPVKCFSSNRRFMDAVLFLMELSRSILKTIAYFDLFNYPLSLEDIRRF